MSGKRKTAAKTGGKGSFHNDPNAPLVQSLGGGRWCRIFLDGKSRHLVVNSDEFWQFVAEHPRTDRIAAEVAVLAENPGPDSLWPQVHERLQEQE